MTAFTPELNFGFFHLTISSYRLISTDVFVGDDLDEEDLKMKKRSVFIFSPACSRLLSKAERNRTI